MAKPVSIPATGWSCAGAIAPMAGPGTLAIRSAAQIIAKRYIAVMGGSGRLPAGRGLRHGYVNMLPLSGKFIDSTG